MQKELTLFCVIFMDSFMTCPGHRNTYIPSQECTTPHDGGVSLEFLKLFRTGIPRFLTPRSPLRDRRKALAEHSTPLSPPIGLTYEPNSLGAEKYLSYTRKLTLKVGSRDLLRVKVISAQKPIHSGTVVSVHGTLTIR